MREIINAIEKLVVFIVGIVIGILAIIIAGLVGIGIDISKYYPGKLDGFMRDGSDHWQDWKIIHDDVKGDKKSEE
jgi:hypothetical protein